MHLIYGIIIGILLAACTGSQVSPSTVTTILKRGATKGDAVQQNSTIPLNLKEQQAEFKEISRKLCKVLDTENEIQKLRAEGWTILDYEISSSPIKEGSGEWEHWEMFLVGK